jgi:antitoxin VapB
LFSKLYSSQTFKELAMRTVSIFNNGKNQAIRIPKDMEFKGTKELEIIKEGDSIIIRPSKPDWLSFADFEYADSDFLSERNDVISDEGRFEW